MPEMHEAVERRFQLLELLFDHEDLCPTQLFVAGATVDVVDVVGELADDVATRALGARRNHQSGQYAGNRGVNAAMMERIPKSGAYDGIGKTVLHVSAVHQKQEKRQ